MLSDINGHFLVEDGGYKFNEIRAISFKWKLFQWSYPLQRGFRVHNVEFANISLLFVGIVTHSWKHEQNRLNPWTNTWICYFSTMIWLHFVLWMGIVYGYNVARANNHLKYANFHNYRIWILNSNRLLTKCFNLIQIPHICSERKKNVTRCLASQQALKNALLW